MEISNWFKGFENGLERLSPEQRSAFFAECGKNCVNGGTLAIYKKLFEDAEGNIPNDDRFTFVRSNFRYLRNWMRYYGVEQIDGLLADLGVSSHHFDDETRGFSFRFNDYCFALITASV